MLIFEQYKNIMIGGVFTVLILALFIQSYRINSYKDEIAASTAQVSILSTTLDEQNKSYEKLSKESLERTEMALESLNKAKQANGISQSKITRLKAQIGKFKTCDESVDNAKGIL